MPDLSSRTSRSSGLPMLSVKGREGQPVYVTDVDIAFGSMVWLLVKLALAAVPAALIVGIVWAVVVVGIVGNLS